jgi:protease IV
MGDAMKKGRYVLILVLIFVVLIAAAAVSFVFMEFGAAPDIPSASYLEIGLSGPLVEFPETNVLSTLMGTGRALSMNEIWTALRMAAVDTRIAGVLVRLGPLECDWAKCAEIRESLVRFRASGKKAVAYIEEAPQFSKEYYLATGCDRIVLHPLGWLGIPGIGGQVPFFKKALDRLGVRVEVQHVEEYKTAYSMFTEPGFTAAHKEMTESLLGDQFAHFVRAIAEARGKTEAQARALVDQAFFQGQEAVQAGLVDELLYLDEAAALFRRNGRALPRTTLEAYALLDPASVGLNRGRKVALVYGSGPIHDGESRAQTMGADTIVRWLQEAREDVSIAAVVFRVDSPGGSAVASDAIWREVALCKKAKPVVISMSDLAGSGGYWIAMGASRIIAQPQTLTGSIGVLTMKIDASPLLEKLGVTSETVRYGKRSDIFTPFRGLDDEEKSLLRRQLVWIYDRFVEKAAEGRSLKPEAVRKIGRGRVWTGAQAKELGLVDELGGLSTALEAAKSLAGIPEREDVRLVIRPRRLSFWAALFGRREASAGTALPRGLGMVLEWIDLLEHDRVLALMPVGIGY